MQETNIINPVPPIDWLMSLGVLVKKDIGSEPIIQHENPRIDAKSKNSSVNVSNDNFVRQIKSGEEQENSEKDDEKKSHPLLIEKDFIKNLLKCSAVQQYSSVLSNFRLNNLLEQFGSKMSSLDNLSLLLALNEVGPEHRKYYEHQWKKFGLLQKSMLDTENDSDVNCIIKANFITFKLESKNCQIEFNEITAPNSEEKTRQELLGSFSKEVGEWVHDKIVVREAITSREMHLIIMLEEARYNLTENLKYDQLNEWESVVDSKSALYGQAFAEKEPIEKKISLMICVREDDKKNKLVDSGCSQSPFKFYPMSVPLILKFLQYFGPTEVSKYSSFVEAQAISANLSKVAPEVPARVLQKKISL